MFHVVTASGDRCEDERQLLESLEAMLESSHGDLMTRYASLANAAALLGHWFDDINWVGFYLRRPHSDDLVLGPFSGKPACSEIRAGKGVCGAALSSAQLQLVVDVAQFKGHIACDSASRSELVAPVLVDGQVVAVLDIDSPTIGRFTDADADFAMRIVATVAAYW